ncbi:NLP/P60-like protein [Pseudomonas syringae pv. delphinii]|nr:NlpC/P60 family protein [Pseudomonas syringae group genomosp. 3]RMP25252.1 NLP/P60-like protein [Pseudomonas syringae pv. delphinii]
MPVVRFAPLVPLALVTFLFGCSANMPVAQHEQAQPVPRYQNTVTAQSAARRADAAVLQDELATEDELNQFADNTSYKLPVLADSILERGKALIGTRYKFGGTSTSSGFDCSGFIGYLFREEAGMSLPRSTREMINVDAPLVSRGNLKPGDLLFFSTRGKKSVVSHAAIYAGNQQFIHSSSRRSGGVRIDSLDDAYWSRTFIEAKRPLAMAPGTVAVKSTPVAAQTTAMTSTTVKSAPKRRK